MLHCISIDASRREEHIQIVSIALSRFFHELLAKFTYFCDLRCWTSMIPKRGHQAVSSKHSMHLVIKITCMVGIRDVNFSPKSGPGTELEPHIFWMGPASSRAFIYGPSIEPSIISLYVTLGRSCWVGWPLLTLLSRILDFRVLFDVDRCAEKGYTTNYQNFEKFAPAHAIWKFWKCTGSKKKTKCEKSYQMEPMICKMMRAFQIWPQNSNRIIFDPLFCQNTVKSRDFLDIFWFSSNFDSFLAKRGLNVTRF